MPSPKVFSHMKTPRIERFLTLLLVSFWFSLTVDCVCKNVPKELL